MKNFLFISNGLGEDSITLSVIRALLRLEPKASVFALPIVGSGVSYESVDCVILGPRTAMPSGGVIPGNPANLARDVRSGLVSLTLSQIGVIREYSRKVDAVVTVGDVYPAILAALFAKGARRIMIATAKSDYVSPHNAFERFVMRSFFERVFLRDEPTAAGLRDKGVSNAVWVGNAMMDCLEPEGVDFGVGDGGPLVAVLPGSRSSAFSDMPVIAGAVGILSGKIGGRYAAVIPRTMDPAALAKSAGWAFRPCSKGDCTGFVEGDGASIGVYFRGMPDLLRGCDVVIGQAGTANEQAAGLGKPVVAFDSFSDEKMGWYRKRQKGLLGDAVSVVKKDSSAVAGEVIAIMGDGERRRRMSEEGRKRLGPPGGAAAMARFVLDGAV